MKKLFTLLFIVITLAGYTQYYYLPHINAGKNPGALNKDAEYPVGGGIPAGWTQVHAAAQATPSWSLIDSIPFAFKFNNNPVFTFRASSSGIVTFASVVGAAPSYTNQTIPNATVPDSSVVIWGLAGTGSNDFVMSKTFGTAPNRQFWISYTSYSSTVVSNPTAFWTYWAVVLEETSNKIYIVDQRTGNDSCKFTVGIQLTGSSAIQLPGSPNFKNFAGTDATPADNTFYEFIQGVQPAYDIANKTMDLYPYQLITQAPYSIDGKITNLGSASITSMNVNYSVDGGTPVTSNVTGLSIPFASDYIYSHPTKWTPAGLGDYVIKTWMSNINGNNDLNNLNDTVTKTITVTASSSPRNVLHEGYTSSTCAPCVAGNANLKTVLNMGVDSSNWTCIKYQMSWPTPGDPYYTAEGGERRTYYGVNAVPWLLVDGGFNGNTSNYTSTLLNSAKGKPSFFELVATYAQFSKDIRVDVTIKPKGNFSGNFKLQMAVIEYRTYNNVGNNGETEFFYVMKKMLPNASGTAVGPFTNNVDVAKTQSYTFKGNYILPPNATVPVNHAIEHSVENFNNLGVVVWLQNETTKEVMQSTWATKVVGINENTSGSGIISMFPNPATTEATLHYFLNKSNNVKVEVYNMMGQKVYAQDLGVKYNGKSEYTLNTEDMTEGMYFVKLTIGKEVFTSKLNVTK